MLRLIFLRKILAHKTATFHIHKRCASADQRTEHKIKNMNTRNFALICFLILIAFNSYGQIEQDSISAVQKVEKQVEKQTEIQQLKVPIYKLFPTTNYWTFIKLDTRNGKMWQVHFTISEEGYQGELILNSSSLIWDDKEMFAVLMQSFAKAFNS